MVTIVSMVLPVRRSAPRLPPDARSPGKPRGLPDSSANLRWTDGLSNAVVGTTYPKLAARRPDRIWPRKRSMSPVVYVRLDSTTPTGMKAEGKRGLSGQIKNGMT
eukprot:7380230-Prymnesium_polylepis.2